MNNRAMILRVLFVVLVLLGLAQLFGVGGDPGLGNVVTILHLLTGLVVIGMIEMLWSQMRANGQTTNLKMITRGLFVVIILMALAMLFDLAVGSLFMLVLVLHILAGLGMIALFEAIWARRRA
ncbi:MAG TPA: hypothetical protein VFM49_06400 [Chloroflexia bacterium]|nr:hypothetical protein [Chloroflexia bacterium]